MFPHLVIGVLMCPIGDSSIRTGRCYWKAQGVDRHCYVQNRASALFSVLLVQ